jgi:hypothetical protein
MNVSQLRAALAEQEEIGNGEMEVKFAYNYGDYWRTQVASSVDSVSSAAVKYSDYHSMDKVLVEDDEHEMPADARTVLILS